MVIFLNPLKVTKLFTKRKIPTLVPPKMTVCDQIDIPDKPKCQAKPINDHICSYNKRKRPSL